MMDASTTLTRRRALLAAASSVATTTLLAGCRDGEQSDAAVAMPEPRPGLPERQHAWEPVLATDRFGNRVAPRHHRLLFFDVQPTAGPNEAANLEAAFRTLERQYPHGPDGLLMLAAWAPSWFKRAGVASPVPTPTALSDTESPEFDDAHMCVHLASNNERIVRAADRALTARADDAGGPGPRVPALDAVLRLRGRRAGFIGERLARRAGRRVELPAGVQIDAESPLMMGFRSGMVRNQATEDAVTIADGSWRGGTTMHVSQIALTLGSWYRSLDDDARAARMFAPGVSPAQVEKQGRGVDVPSSDLAATARRHGVVGHAQTAAQARRNDKPVILRRDFNGIADGRGVTHFVSLQQDIEDFVATRTAMNGITAVDADSRVGVQVNNGINEWISVHRRANYYVPTRSRRAFPGLDGWDAA